MELSLITFNIHKGMDWKGGKFTFREIKKALEKEGADLVFLQEVHGENQKHESKYDLASQFEDLADSIWKHYSYSQNASYQHGHHGNVILSHYPIIKHEKIDMTLNRFEQRGLLYSQIGIPESEDVIHCFCAHLNLRGADRQKQYELITKALKERCDKDSKIIFAGDFNDWSRKASSSLQQEFNLHDAHKTLHGKYAKTFNSLFPVLSLDRVYLQNLKVKVAETLDAKEWRSLSDHLPIKVKLLL